MKTHLVIKEKNTIDTDIIKAFDLFLNQCQGVAEKEKTYLLKDIRWDLTIDDLNADNVITDIERTLKGIKLTNEYITQYQTTQGVTALVPFDNAVVVLNVSYETSFYYNIARVETKRNNKNIVILSERLKRKYIYKVRDIAFYLYLLNKAK